MRSGRPRRDGYVMVLVAMLLFGLMAMAALVIDLGLARLTQRQMQVAADAAALEGLQFINADGRKRASTIASWHFDDDLGSTNVDHVFGAGPVVNFSGGAGDASLNASQTLDTSTPYYRPNLQQNVGDDIAGDMLSGNYAFEPPLGSSPAARKEFHQEMPDYSRGDFPDPDPGGALGLVTHPAFLVRLRRTDEAPVASVRTSGPPLPYLFGRGSLVSREAVGNGIQARGTSIAVLQPVVCVGNANATLGIPGKLDLAVPINEWVGGAITSYRAYAENSIGGVAGVASGPLPDQEGYIAIYDPTVGDRVIGFQAASFDSSGIVSPLPGFSINNASAVFAFPFISDETSDETVFLQRETHREDLLRLPVSGGS